VHVFVLHFGLSTFTSVVPCEPEVHVGSSVQDINMKIQNIQLVY
jgi:hypothetical protein